jgi:hypothetical protein
MPMPAIFHFIEHFESKQTSRLTRFTFRFSRQSIAHVAAQKNYFFRLPINLVIRHTNSQPIVRMTAKEFMMGYESPLTTIGNTLLPHWIHFDKVGLIDRVSELRDDSCELFS